MYCIVCIVLWCTVLYCHASERSWGTRPMIKYWIHVWYSLVLYRYVFSVLWIIVLCFLGLAMCLRDLGIIGLWESLNYMYFILLYCIVLFFLDFDLLSCILLYYIVLYWIVLYRTLLNWNESTYFGVLYRVVKIYKGEIFILKQAHYQKMWKNAQFPSYCRKYQRSRRQFQA